MPKDYGVWCAVLVSASGPALVGSLGARRGRLHDHVPRPESSLEAPRGGLGAPRGWIHDNVALLESTL